MFDSVYGIFERENGAVIVYGSIGQKMFYDTPKTAEYLYRIMAYSHC